MNIAVIGGGFTGLTAAYELGKSGHTVTVFEREKALGGLAHGFKEPGWSWYLEYTYHHLFTNDRTALGLIQELGLQDKIRIRRPVTAALYNGKPYQLDSPVHLLLFPGLPIVDKLRTAALLGFLKLNPFWKPLENITSEQLLTSIGGLRAYRAIWEPLLTGKFNTYAPDIQAAWFWARIKKRTPRLVYMEGGFKTLIDALEKAIKKQRGIIKTESGIMNHESWIRNNKSHNSLFIIHNSKFDKVLITVPTQIAQKIVPEIISPSVPHLWAQTLILETKEPVLQDVYWLNITDRSFPFLAAVAHTNFMNTSHYGGHHITYFGNYLPDGHKYLSMEKEELLKKFLPFIKRLNHNSLFTIHNSFLFTAPYAQPVHRLRYSSRIPQMETAVPNVYLANMDSIVPWDRGINYSVELGQKSAAVISQKHI